MTRTVSLLLLVGLLQFATLPSNALGNVEADTSFDREYCGYAIHTPEAVMAQIRRNMGVAGVAYLPPNSISPALRSPYWTVIRNGAVVARFDYRKSVSGSVLIIRDVHGRVLFEIEENLHPCEVRSVGGLCKAINMTPLLETSVKAPPFTLYQSRNGFDYERYGESISPVLWRMEFRQAVNRLLTFFVEEEDTLPLVALSREEALVISLAGVHGLAPYLDRLGFFSSGTNLVVTGRLPHYAHDLLVDRAIATGFTNIDPRITIDSAAAIPAPESARVLGCLY